jgi:hypothetical protein
MSKCSGPGVSRAGCIVPQGILTLLVLLVVMLLVIEGIVGIVLLLRPRSVIRWSELGTRSRTGFCFCVTRRMSPPVRTRVVLHTAGAGIGLGRSRLSGTFGDNACECGTSTAEPAKRTSTSTSGESSSSSSQISSTSEHAVMRVQPPRRICSAGGSGGDGDR